MTTYVHVAGVERPLPFPGSADEFRRLQPDHGGALRWEDGGNRYIVDTNVTYVAALVEIKDQPF